MPNKLRLNALLVLTLAGLFAVFFDFTKHQPALAAVNPFGEDPYDAVGTFAFQTALFLGLLSLVRAFWPYRQPPPPEQPAVTLRTQAAGVLAVLVALAGDGVALGRHPVAWLGTPAGAVLAGLTLGLAAATLGVGWVVARGAPAAVAPRAPHAWRRPGAASLIVLLVLGLYPERLIDSVPGALGTVVVGAALLFWPVWAWGEFWFSSAGEPRTAAARWVWAAVIGVGVLLGLAIVLRELTEGGGPADLAGGAFIVAVFVGLEVAGILIGYAFLGQYLGLFRRPIVA